jgi:hypothetical protein
MKNSFIFRLFLAVSFVVFLNPSVIAFSPFDLLGDGNDQESDELSGVLGSEFLFSSELDGEFKRSASIIILDKRTGKPSPIISIEKGKAIEHGGMLINLENCWQEKEDKLYRDARALISVSHDRDRNISLWISSKFPGLSSIGHSRYDIILQHCI